MSEITSADGYAVGSIDALGDGPGFRKIRSALGVTAFGVNAIVLPPGIETGVHFHERQQELYVLLRGRVEITFGDGTSHTLEPGGLARVDPSAHRALKNVGDEDALYVVVGAADGEGYVGRDGRRPEGETERTRPTSPQGSS